MRIFESQSRHAITAVLTEAEAVLYREVFRTGQPVSIPEFGNKKFIIREISRFEDEGAPDHAWRMVIEQETAETIA